MAMEALKSASYELRYAVNIKHALDFKDVVWKNTAKDLITYTF